MFHAELISLSRGQSYDQIELLEVRHGDFEKYNIKRLFADKTIAFFHKSDVIICHPWGIRVILLDRRPRTGNNSTSFDRIILDGDVSYGPGVIIDPRDEVELNIPDIFEDPNEVIDQVTFSCSQGTIITHDANIVSIVSAYHRKNRGVTRSEIVENHVQPQPIPANGATIVNGAIHSKISRRQR